MKVFLFFAIIFGIAAAVNYFMPMDENAMRDTIILGAASVLLFIVSGILED